jgi:hypothetical protein
MLLSKPGYPLTGGIQGDSTAFDPTTRCDTCANRKDDSGRDAIFVFSGQNPHI